MSATALRPPTLTPERGGPRRLRLRWALVAAIVLVLAVFATWLVAFSPAFGVRSVKVDGERTLRADAIEQAADIDYGQPLVRVDTTAIAHRVESLPQVESARVSTSFPSGLVITVTERTPVGYVTVAGRRMLVDRSGVQYPSTNPQAIKDETANLPRLVVPADTDHSTTGGAVATVAAALPRSLRVTTSAIEALDPTAITVTLRGKHGSVLVRWGGPQRSATKAAVVGALVDRKHVALIDVTNPDRPFTRDG